MSDKAQEQLLRVIGSLVRGRSIPGFWSEDDGDLKALGTEYVRWLVDKLEASPHSHDS